MAEDQAVTNFRDYLRIKTVQPDPDYDGAFEWLKKMAGELGLPWKIIEVAPEANRSVFVMTWEGTQPELPSVLFNSHIDVVPVYPEHWKYDPFEAHKDENGDIYARGSQDMKCVGNQYIEAVRRLKKEGKHFPRTLHFSFVPDEEIGGVHGMCAFVKHEEFKKLNIAFAMDEGLANPTDAMTVFYGERSPWWIRVTCPGRPGHGSRFMVPSSAEKLRRVMNSFLEFRNAEEAKLNANPKLSLGDVTTINLNRIWGGVQQNVCPAEYVAGFDMRITPTTDLVEFEKMINKWCKDAGDDVTIEYLQKFEGPNLTSTGDDNPWWVAFKKVTDELELKLDMEIYAAMTDLRYIRQAGYPAIGFSPINHTPILLHDHNEFLNENVYLRGIDIYCKILPAIASVPAQ